MNRGGEWLADRVAALAAIAVVFAVLVPARGLAGDSDLLLAVLVGATALQIEPARLRELRGQVPIILVLAVGSVLVLMLIAWALSRAFSQPVRDGVLSLGLASSEVASVGLIGLAGGDAVLGVGVLTASLVTSAILGPLLAGAVGHVTGHGNELTLLGRFALVVLLPLVVGVGARGVWPGFRRAEGALNGLAALTVCVLLYAALSAVGGSGRLGSELIASVAFVLAAGVVAVGCARFGRAADPAAVGLTTWLRDFAVAAALASQAFGTAAASVAGVYGAVMLLAGTLTATVLRRRTGQRATTPASSKG